MIDVNCPTNPAESTVVSEVLCGTLLFQRTVSVSISTAHITLPLTSTPVTTWPTVHGWLLSAKSVPSNVVSESAVQVHALPTNFGI